jgi:hypothetical protein
VLLHLFDSIGLRGYSLEPRVTWSEPFSDQANLSTCVVDLSSSLDTPHTDTF